MKNRPNPCLCRKLTLKTLDRTSQEQRAWSKVRKAESRYARALRGIARIIEDIVNGFDNPTTLQAMLRKYAETIGPWAESVARRMILEVGARDLDAWKSLGADVSKGIVRDIESGPIGERFRALMADQVTLIKSLPLDAAQRVHDLAIETVEAGGRSGEITAKILETGRVTKARAKLIARTEVGRAATTITQARAEYAGSTGYIWRTAGDSDVRPSHKAMNGKFFSWSDPPVTDGMRGHAGSLPNCRCYCEPIIEE